MHRLLRAQRLVQFMQIQAEGRRQTRQRTGRPSRCSARLSRASGYAKSSLPSSVQKSSRRNLPCRAVAVQSPQRLEVCRRLNADKRRLWKCEREGCKRNCVAKMIRAREYARLRYQRDLTRPHTMMSSLTGAGPTVWRASDIQKQTDCWRQSALYKNHVSFQCRCVF